MKLTFNFVFFLIKGNLNPFNATIARTLDYIKSIEKTFYAKTFPQKLKSIKSSIYADSSLGESFMSQIGFTLDNMLLSCLYANQITCKSSDFKSYTSFDRGNCFTFNADISNITTSSQTGQYYGLQLELFGGFDGKGLFDFDLSDYLNLKK